MSSEGAFFSLRWGTALFDSFVGVFVYFFEELLKSLGYCSLRFVCWGVCLLLRRVAQVIGVLLSSICLLGCLFTSSKSCLACCVICSLASSKVYFDCGVAWLVGLLGLLRGDLLFLSFSVSINRLEVYK